MGWPQTVHVLKCTISTNCTNGSGHKQFMYQSGHKQYMCLQCSMQWLAVPYWHRMNVAAITIDGAFATRCSRFLHAKQESEIMMILTSVLANFGL